MEDGAEKDSSLLKDLYDISWESFEKRRGFEWKITLGIWTVLVATCGFLFGDKVTRFSNWIEFSIALATVILGAIYLIELHKQFLCNLAKGNEVDRRKAFHFEDEMRETRQLKLPQALADQEKAQRAGVGKDSYAHKFQVQVTRLLCVTALVAFLWKTHPYPWFIP